MIETIFVGGAFVIALIAPIMVWFGLVGAGSVTHRLNSKTIFTLMLLLLGLAGLLGQIFTERDLSDVQQNIRPGFLGLQNVSIFIWLNRLANIFVILVSLGVIFQYMTALRRPSLPTPSILLAYFFSVTLGLILSSLFGTKPAFIHPAFYAPILFAAVYMLHNLQTEQVVFTAKAVLLFYIYGSLLVLLIDPDWAALWAYKDGLIPGFQMRLFGVSPHPNSLAMIALAFLMLEGYQANTSKWRVFNILSAVAVLVLAQSKTAWIASFCWFIIFFISKERGKLSFPGKSRRYAEDRSIFLILVFLTLLTGVLMAILAAPSLLDAVIDRANLGNERGSLTTLTGRTLLWEVTLDQWKSNPWFGYGPSLWDPEFRIKYGYLGAGQAHNQIVQTLGESGLLGLLGLTVYLLVLAKIALKHHLTTKGLSTSLLLVILIRCVTESPFRNQSLLDASFLLHLILFAVFLSLERQQRTRTVVPACGAH